METLPVRMEAGVPESWSPQQVLDQVRRIQEVMKVMKALGLKTKALKMGKSILCIKTVETTVRMEQRLVLAL